tara:strand:- start:2324 stop:3859 length:1536 start_codon:yes stop_codon:yes gene_type:complete
MSKRKLKVAVKTTPTVFDVEQPAGFGDDLGSDLFGSFYDQLLGPSTYYDDKNFSRLDWHNLRNILAEKWWFSEDHMACFFQIRPGVYSKDGNELTANEVAWGWERAFALRDVGKWVARLASVQEFENIEIVDKYTVKFNLTAPNPSLPRLMCQNAPSVYDIEAFKDQLSDEDPWGKNAIANESFGFGPYILDQAGSDSISIMRHDNYWQGKPEIEHIELIRYDDHQKAIDALISGDVDLMPGVLDKDLSSILKHDHLQVNMNAMHAGMFLHLDPEFTPLNDVKVRYALAHAMPIDTIITEIYNNQADRWNSFVKIESPGYDHNTWPFEYDPEKAQKLLLESSSPDGFECDFYVFPGDGFAEAANFIVDTLSKLGIKLNILAGDDVTDRNKQMRENGHVAPIMMRGSTDGRGMRVADPMYALYHDFGPGRMRLFPFRYHNEEFFDALGQLPKVGHGESWLKQVSKLQLLLNQDAVMIPICNQIYKIAHSENVLGCRQLPDNRMPFGDMSWNK